MSQVPTGNKLFLLLIEKLNADSNSLQKAEEYFRFIHDKATGRYVNDFTKAILCLDLASSIGGFAFDKDKALKLSGLKQQNYKAYSNLYEKLLNLDKPQTIPEVCVKLGCSEVKDLAQQILLKYEKNNITDGNNPMYFAAAVSAACKMKHIKVAKSKFLEVSRLKATQWKELEAKFQNYVQSSTEAPHKASAEPELLPEELEGAQEYRDAAELKDQMKGQDEHEIEDYEIWKARILREAKAVLQAENKNNFV